MATAPTAAEVRARSRLDFSAEGYPEDDGELGLQERVVDPAVNWLWYVTARSYSDAQTDQFPQIEDMLDLAVRMRSEQIVLQARYDQLETSADIDMISSFSAGLYSETRRGSNDTVKPPRMLNPWPPLNDLLWLLLGLFPGETNDLVSDRADYWEELMTGQVAPAWGTVEVDWGRGMGLWRKGPSGWEWPGWPGSLPGPPPDPENATIDTGY
jgi:hypothetical protein